MVVKNWEEEHLCETKQTNLPKYVQSETLQTQKTQKKKHVLPILAANII